MANKSTGISQKIDQVLQVLSTIKAENPTSQDEVKNIRSIALVKVANKLGVYPGTVRDKCMRQIDIPTIGKFDELVYLWLKKSDESLKKILLNNTKTEKEVSIINEFFSGAKGTTDSPGKIKSFPRYITQEHLDEILKNHQIWLKSNGKEGTQADFTNFALIDNQLLGVNFEKAIFSSSRIEDVDLRNANLSETLFIGSNLIKTNFKGANLNGANFTNANLENIDFSHTKLDSVTWENVKVKNLKGLSSKVEDQIKSQIEFSNESLNLEQKLGELEDSAIESIKIDIASRAITDKPSEIDLLNFSDYAEALTDFITNAKTKKPIAIAIDAPWGGGKSTLMGMIKKMVESKSINEDQSFITIWFNAWKYEKEESLWAALVMNVLKKIRSKYGFFRKIGLWFKLNWKRFDKQQFFNDFLYSLLSLLILFIIGFLFIWVYCLIFNNNFISDYLKYGGYTGLIALFFKIGNELYKKLTGPFNLKVSDYIRKPNYEERIGFIAQFEEDFRMVIETVTKKGKWPLIIFIDDLDRCAAPKPVEIIEAINLLLDSEHCVFIIGMDSKSVAASIETKYKDMKENLEKQKISNEDIRLGQRFLEKIIQVHFHIPKIKEGLLEDYIDKLMTTKEQQKTEPKDKVQIEIEELIESEQRDGKSLQDAEKVARNKRPRTSEEIFTKAKEEIRAKTFDDSEETKTAIISAAKMLSSNPRKIKRFINNFRLQAFIANRRGLIEEGSINLNMLAKSVTISTRWPDIFEWISKDSNILYDVKNAVRIKNEIENLVGKIEKNATADKERKANIEKLETELKQNKEQPFISSCLENEDIISMINKLSDDDIVKIQDCIYLTNMTAAETSE